jgi:exodeoxyribonuclease V alpha subunit
VRGVNQGEVQIEGEVMRITFESPESGFRVVKLAVEGRSDRLAVVGTFPALPVGSRVRVRGTLVLDKRHGEQLRAESVTEIAPKTLAGVERYLGSGAVRGIGDGFAKRIVEAFGNDTLRVLDEEPERLREVQGLGSKRAEAIARAWNDQRSVREVMVFLEAHGASPALAVRIFKRYGPRAVHVVSRDPYRLAIDVWGIGFRTADRIAAELGIAKDSPRRMEAGVLQTLHDATEAGHTYVEVEELLGRAAKMLEVDDADPAVRERLSVATRSPTLEGHVVLEYAGDRMIAFTARLHAAEVRLAKRIAELACASSPPLEGAALAVRAYETETGITLAPEQKAAVERAATAPLLVVTGGPGVGKTTLVRAILSMFDRAGIAVRLAAPTGRAAKRMTDATSREASTLHRLLEFEPKSGRFKRDASRPIEAGALIVDEASMVDLPTADALLQAVAPGTRVVFVGDVDQLPSIGPGAVLRDLIQSRTVACVRLTQIFRQAAESSIVTNAHRINSGEPPLAPDPGDPSADFFVIERRDPEAAAKTVVELVTSRIPRRFGMDPMQDIQVLTPMHRGAVGSRALNETLQAALNPHGAPMPSGARTFRAGDKVMQLRNNYDKNVYNGDIGRVAAVDAEQGTALVRYDDREVEYDSSSLDDLTLAYASSIHKAQGSEYPAVVVVLLTSHFVMLSKNLLYTAVTRGKRLVVLVCDPRAITLALAEDRRDERRTRLAERTLYALGGRAR